MNIDAVTEQLIPLIQRFRKSEFAELEGSIGIIQVNQQGNFKSGVNFSYFKALFAEFSKTEAKTWSKFEDKQHFATFNFGDNIRGRYNVKQNPEFIRKVTLAKVDIDCPERSYDLRVSLRDELPVVNFVPKSPPEFVRLHERWSFTYKNSWRYDFSKIASGTTKETACKNSPIFEIELELLKQGDFIVTATDQEIAHHIVHKLIDLLGRFNKAFELLPVTLRVSKTWTSLQQIATGEI
jgi:hypothetical protein